MRVICLRALVSLYLMGQPLVFFNTTTYNRMQYPLHTRYYSDNSLSA